LWRAPRATRWKERLVSMGGRARRAMARDCLFGCDLRCWLCHFRALRFSTDPTLRSRCARRPNHRHSGKPVRLAAAPWREVEKKVILDNWIVTRPYGRAFLQALPKCAVKII